MTLTPTDSDPPTRRTKVVRRPRGGKPGLLRVVRQSRGGTTVREYWFREVRLKGLDGLDGRGFALLRTTSPEFDHAPETFVFSGKSGRLCDPGDGEGGELLEALEALINAGLL